MWSVETDDVQTLKVGLDTIFWCGNVSVCSLYVTYQSTFGSDEWSVLAIHLVVKSTCVTQIMACAISPPQGSGGSPTVHTLTSFWYTQMIWSTLNINTLYSLRNKSTKLCFSLSLGWYPQGCMFVPLVCISFANVNIVYFIEGLSLKLKDDWCTINALLYKLIMHLCRWCRLSFMVPPQKHGKDKKQMWKWFIHFLSLWFSSNYLIN